MDIQDRASAALSIQVVPEVLEETLEITWELQAQQEHTLRKEGTGEFGAPAEAAEAFLNM